MTHHDCSITMTHDHHHSMPAPSPAMTHGHHQNHHHHKPAAVPGNPVAYPYYPSSTTAAGAPVVKPRPADSCNSADACFEVLFAVAVVIVLIVLFILTVKHK